MEDNDRCGPYKTCKIAEAYNAFLSLSRGEVRPQVVNVNLLTFIYIVENVGTKGFFAYRCATHAEVFLRVVKRWSKTARLKSVHIFRLIFL